MNPALALLGSAALALPADVSLFLGPPGGTGDVEVRDEAGLDAPFVPPELEGIRLLPLDVSGRTQLDELSPDRARLRADLPGASRLVLPDGHGVLYRYERVLAAGGARFGLFRVTADGVAEPLLEVGGTGRDGDGDPLLPTVAVSADGAALLVATTPAAGGDLFEVDVTAATAVERTDSLPPMAFGPAGIFLSADWGIGAGPDGVVRFPRTAAGSAQRVGFPAGTTWFSGEIALSGDGTVAATSAGAGPQSQHVYTFAAAGPPLEISETPAEVLPAGYLPDEVFGPYLALDEAGESCAWLVLQQTPDGPKREAFLTDAASPVPTDPVQLTADGLFVDTLDEIGVLFFAPPGLILAVGERSGDPAGGIESLDFYGVPAAVPSPTVTNLSKTSGTLSPPYTKAGISPQAIHRIPGTHDLLIASRESSTGELILMPGDGSEPSTVLADVKAIEQIEPAPGHLFLGLRRKNALDTLDLVRLDLADPLAPDVLARLGGGVVAGRSTSAGDWAAFALTGGPLEWMVRVRVSLGTGALAFAVPLSFGPTIALDPDGRARFTVDFPGGPPSVFLGWQAPAGFSLLGSEPEGLVLPGS